MLKEMLEIEKLYAGCDRLVPEESLIRHFGPETFACALEQGDIRVCSVPCNMGKRCCWLSDRGRAKLNVPTSQGYH